MAKFTLETPIKDMMANEKAVAAINSVTAGLAQGTADDLETGGEIRQRNAE